MLRGPGAHFFIKFYRTGMIRDGKIRDGLVFFPPLLEERVNRLQLGDIVPPCLHHGGDAALIDLGRADDPITLISPLIPAAGIAFTADPP